MRKTKIIVVVFCLLLLVIIIFKNQSDQFQVYSPKVFNGSKIVSDQGLNTHKHQQNVIKVLNYYKQSWKLEKGKLLISKKIDLELMWNYTNKANDSLWLSRHKVNE
jgi:hypothetical protein